MKEILADYNLTELQEKLELLGEKKYRGAQVFEGIAKGLSFDEMTSLPLFLREKLKANFIDEGVKIIETLKGKDAEKYLYLLHDGNIIEGVLMRYSYGNTLCVSTQVGCRMGCVFCASTMGGLVRSLSSGEILSQVLKVNRVLGGGRSITNIVLMGSGEPLDNYDNVIRFIKNVSAKEGLNVSPRNISLSTCGLADKMKRLADEGLPVTLTVSLHSPFDDERARIVPSAKSFKIESILEACAYYFERTGRRYIFEYTMIKEKNDSERHAKALIALLKGKPCHINLIRLNEVEETGLKSTGKSDAYLFLEMLERGGLSVTLRRQTGSDIAGACGQLRNQYVGQKQPISSEKKS